MDVITWSEIAAVVVAIIAILTVMFGTQRYNADKRSRIYTRLDEYKDHLKDEVKKEYARKDMCALTHQHVGQKLQEIETQTALIPDIAAQLKILVSNGKKI